jgi:gluconate kinase
MSQPKELNFDMFTIIMMMGPMGCGKTYFASNLCKQLEEQINSKGLRPNVQYVSTESIRKMLSGSDSIPKHSCVLGEISAYVYDLLYQYVLSVTSFPINAHFVVIDSSALNTEFRDKIRKIADVNNYALDIVMFSYDDQSNYFINLKKCSEGADQKFITDTITNQIKKMRSIGFKGIGQKFHQKHIIKKPNLNYICKIKNLDYYASTVIDSELKYFVVGDIHCCIDEFIELICRFGYIVENGIIKHGPKTKSVAILCVGDLIDKGEKSVETINFFYENLLHSEVKILLVKGNHE